jgi:hypothetical protein
MDKFWYESPKILFQRNRVHEFWPSKQMTYSEKLNALTRFVLYGGAIIAVVKNDTNAILISLLLVIMIAIIGKSKAFQKYQSSLQNNHNFPKVQNMTNKKCQKPTLSNPFANVLMSDYKKNPEREPACYSELVNEEIDDKFHHKYGKNSFDVFNRRLDQRQFFSNPSTTIPNDSTGFAKWLYNQDGKPTCKELGVMCTGTEAF